MKNNTSSAPTLIDGKDWFLTVTRNMSFWHQCLLTLGWYCNTKDFGVDSNLEVLSITANAIHTHCFFYNPNYKNYLEKLADVFRDKKSVDSLRLKYITYGNELLASLDTCLQKLDSSSLSNFFDTYQKYTAGLMITTAYSKSGTDALSAALISKGYTEAEIPRIIATVTYPAQHTPLFTSQIDLVNIAISIQKNGGQIDSVASKKLNDWVLMYGNIPVNYCDEPWTIKDAQKQLDSFLQKNCEHELVLMKENHQTKVRESENLLKKINDPHISILAYGLAEGTYINEYRKNIFSVVSLKYRPMFRKIAEMSDSKDWRDCFYLTPSEMLDVVSGKKLSLVKIKAERETCGVTVDTLHKGKLKMLDEMTVRSLYEYVQKLHGTKKPDVDHSISELKGFSASKGSVKGIVKVVLSSKEFDKVNVGDILVTTMTSVDFVPVMERAAAFVTNEGGIMCHASIIAREMGKPCIIGTKLATQVFKDGDMVEVDATKGLIKKLSK